ncbi:hypothetical protein ABZ464_08105 [Streptomyces sp. NPDC005820]|uniref:hypothetical protein n=1 Tax=Streptomyces sp. NPDC005820 TaxID=3157069 RepID=UPI00340ADFBF
MAQARFDRRVRTLVEVRGGPDDRAEAEQRFQAHGWPVRGSSPAGQDPYGTGLDPDPEARVYDVEVRLFGMARDCERGAAARVRKTLRGAGLEAYVRLAEPIRRDREMFTQWRITDDTARHSAPPHSWRRRTARLLTRWGRHDAGGVVSGRPGEALRITRAHTPGVPRAGIRPLDGRWRVPASYWPEEETERRLTHVVAWSLLTAATLVFAHGRTGSARWLWITAALLGTVGVVAAGARLVRSGRGHGIVVAVGLCAFLSALGLGLFDGVGDGDGDGGGWTRGQVVMTALVGGVVTGLWLLVRQWTWGEWAAWAVPLVVTLALSSFLAAGSVLHALYADGLSFTPGDFEVPAIWQVLAALKLLTLLSPVLAVPAWWGIARHRHHFYAMPAERMNVVLNVCVFLLVLIGGAVLALQSARTAVDRTVLAAERHETPPAYFGVEPEWTCVQPVVPPARLSGEGPPLDPARPYLSFGVSGDTAVLWNPDTHEPLTLRASQVRLVPDDSPNAPCPTDAPQ